MPENATPRAGDELQDYLASAGLLEDVASRVNHALAAPSAASPAAASPGSSTASATDPPTGAVSGATEWLELQQQAISLQRTVVDDLSFELQSLLQRYSRMVAAGGGSQLVETYRKVRSSFLKQAVESLNSHLDGGAAEAAAVGSMGWSDLELTSKQWAQHVYLLVRDRRGEEHVYLLVGVVWGMERQCLEDILPPSTPAHTPLLHTLLSALLIDGHVGVVWGMERQCLEDILPPSTPAHTPLLHTLLSALLNDGHVISSLHSLAQSAAAICRRGLPQQLFSLLEMLQALQEVMPELQEDLCSVGLHSEWRSLQSLPLTLSLASLQSLQAMHSCIVRAGSLTTLDGSAGGGGGEKGGERGGGRGGEGGEGERDGGTRDGRKSKSAMASSATPYSPRERAAVSSPRFGATAASPKARPSVAVPGSTSPPHGATASSPRVGGATASSPRWGATGALGATATQGATPASPRWGAAAALGATAAFGATAAALVSPRVRGAVRALTRRASDASVLANSDAPGGGSSAAPPGGGVDPITSYVCNFIQSFLSLSGRRNYAATLATACTLINRSSRMPPSPSSSSPSYSSHQHTSAAEAAAEVATEAAAEAAARKALHETRAAAVAGRGGGGGGERGKGTGGRKTPPRLSLDSNTAGERGGGGGVFEGMLGGGSERVSVELLVGVLVVSLREYLDKRAAYIEDAAMRELYQMNNLHYLMQSMNSWGGWRQGGLQQAFADAKGNGRLELALALSTFIDGSTLQKHVAAFQTCALSKVLAAMSDRPRPLDFVPECTKPASSLWPFSLSDGGDHEVLAMSELLRLRAFNRAMEELVEAQKRWAIPDAALRLRVCTAWAACLKDRYRKLLQPRWYVLLTRC
ncbi:unnamed protein product [Closterium sp. NIES-65]|nr:unnamed protein product [Closterium sp. NIES-65]